MAMRRTVIERYPRGAFLFHTGDPASDIFILLEGSIKKANVNLVGMERPISIYVPGEIFGHLFLGRYHHRISSAMALEPVTAARIAEARWTALLTGQPSIALHFIRYLADEQRETPARVHALMNFDARTRLLGTLLSLGRRYCDPRDTRFQLPPIMQEDLAHLSVMNRSTLNVLLHRLRRSGIVIEERPRLGRRLVIDRAALEAELRA